MRFAAVINMTAQNSSRIMGLMAKVNQQTPQKQAEAASASTIKGADQQKDQGDVISSDQPKAKSSAKPAVAETKAVTDKPKAGST